MKSPQAEVYMIDMELGSRTLRDRIKEVNDAGAGKSFEPYEIWSIIQQVAAGVADIRKRGIIHRDLKPENSITLLKLRYLMCAVIQTTVRGGLNFKHVIWKVADFGITTAGTSKNLIATDNKRGTVHYLAPEVILAQPGVPSYTNRVDIWSLGAILYEICTGIRAFSMVFTSPPNIYTSSLTMPCSFIGILPIALSLTMIACLERTMDSGH